MYTPGSDSFHQAAHHRAVETHNAAHHAAVDHARRSAAHSRAAFGTHPFPDARAGRAEPHGGYPSGGRRSGVIGLVRFVLTLTVFAVLAVIVLLVLEPTGPAWLVEFLHLLDGFR
jgi:hypothetical protein